MAGSEDKKDELLKAPHGAEQPTNPVGTPVPSQPTSEFSLTDSSLRGLAERFELLAEVGRGGMGIVYRARDRETGAVVALKVLRPDIAAHAAVIERFKSELLLARKITHKNVCRIYDLHRFGPTAAIAMEYVEGESLRAFLHCFGDAPLRRGQEWARQICSALTEAHAQGVVHRDLKPENILIDRQGQVKVMDFGIARSIESATSTATSPGAIVGTPAYMSPEQAEGKPADARSDIYSLGLVLYEMFTGRPAFKADTPVALAVKQIHETPPPARQVEPDLPARIGRAIERCLEKNPKKRFQSVEELESAMKPGAEIEPAAEAPSETGALAVPAETGQWQPRDSWLVGGGLLAAIVFLALFSLVYPYASLRIHFGQEEAVEKAVALVRKFEPAAASGRAEPYWRWWLGERPLSSFASLPEIQQAIALILMFSTDSRWWLREYRVKVRVLGLSEANRQLVYDDYWEVRVNLAPGRAPAWVGLRTDGSLSYLRLPPPRQNEPPPPPSREQAARDGVAYVRQVFGTDVSNLERKLQQDSQTTVVSWELPGPIPDLQRIISFRLGHDGLLRIWEKFPSRHESEMRDQWGPSAVQELLRMRLSGPGGFGLILPLLLLMLVLFFARRLYQGVGRSIILAALCITLSFGSIAIWMQPRRLGSFELVALLIALVLVLLFVRRLYQEPRRPAILVALCVTLSFAGIWFQDHDESEFNWLTASAVAAAIYLFHFFLFATAEDYLWRRLRSRVATWFLLVRRPGGARAAGLSILRGCAFGFIFLAAHTLVVYALGSARLTGPSTFWLEVAALSGRPYLPLYALSYAVLVTIPRVWCLFGFPAALTSGVTRRPFALVAVPAVICAITVFYLPGTTPSVAWVAVYFAALQGVFFSLVFYRYDLLTLACAVFTVETWLLVYPVWTIFSAIQPLQPSLAMMPWFLLLLAGAIIYLRPQLEAARRQIAAVFE